MENKKNRVPKMGRPVKEKDKLSTSINLKLTESDFNSVKEKAEKLGMKATQYARGMTLKGSIKYRLTLEELELLRKVAGMANKLNQLAKRAHIAGFTDVYSEVLGMVDYFKQLLDDR